MNDYNIEALNNWLKHLKDGVNYGFIITWLMQIVTIMIVVILFKK